MYVGRRWLISQGKSASTLFIGENLAIQQSMDVVELENSNWWNNGILSAKGYRGIDQILGFEDGGKLHGEYYLIVI